MRCIIAHFPFDLVKTEVERTMKDVKPEAAVGETVLIGRRTYPIKQVGELITGQDRRDFSTGEVTRALTRLGFTCKGAAAFAPAPARTPLETASALLGLPTPE